MIVPKPKTSCTSWPLSKFSFLTDRQHSIKIHWTALDSSCGDCWTAETQKLVWPDHLICREISSITVIPRPRTRWNHKYRRVQSLSKPTEVQTRDWTESINNYAPISDYMQDTLGWYGSGPDCLLSSMKLSDKDFSLSASSAHMFPEGSTFGSTAD